MPQKICQYLNKVRENVNEILEIEVKLQKISRKFNPCEKLLAFGEYKFWEIEIV